MDQINQDQNKEQQKDLNQNIQQGNTPVNGSESGTSQANNSQPYMQHPDIQQPNIQQPNFQPGFMQMNDMQQAIMNQDVMYQEGLSPKKLLSKAGIALAIFAAVVLGVQTVIEGLVATFRPGLVDTDWYVWAVTAISLVVIGFPVYYLLMKRVPDTPKAKVTKLKPAAFIAIFFICVAAMYITNFFSTILTLIIALIKGEELINPVAEAILGGNFLITLVYAAIVAPVIEELIFRKLLLDKVRRFGDIPAILLTGIAFGLFHLNLSQFFYATVLGFIFAYVTIRTNTVVYSILLHMMINFMSTAIAPLVTDMNLFVVIGIVVWEVIAITTGVVLFVVNLKKIQLVKMPPMMKTSSYFLNAGTILYSAICIVMIVLMTIM